MESIQEFLKDSLRSVDIKTVTKAELKQMYLKKQGIAKLSKEEKKLFSTAVESAYIDFVKNDSCNSEEIAKNNDTEVSDCESASSDVTDDLSHDSGLGDKNDLEAMKETKLSVTKVTVLDDNESSDVKISTEAHKSSYGSPSKPLEKESVPDGKIEVNGTDTVLSSDENVKDNKPVVDTSGESDDEPLIPKKNAAEKSPSKDPSSDSDDEPLMPRKNATKKSPPNDLSSDSDDEPLMPLKKKQKQKNQTEYNTSICDSEDEPLASVKKAVNKANDLNSGESEEEPLVPKRVLKSQSSSNKPKKQKNQDKKLSKTKQKPILSDSEDEESLPAKKANQQKKSLNLDVKSFKKKSKSDQKPKHVRKKVQKSFVDSSDSEELPLISIAKKSSLGKSDKTSLNGSNRKILSDSDNESLTTAKKGKRLPKRKSKISSENSNEVPLMKMKKKVKDESSCDSDEPLSSLRTECRVHKSISKSESEESDDEALISFKVKNSKKLSKTSIKKENKSSRENSATSLACDDSDEDGLPLMRKNSISHSNNSDSDEEPLASFSKNNSSVSSNAEVSGKISTTERKSTKDDETTSKSNMSTHEMDVSDSDEKPLSSFSKRNVKTDAKPHSSVKRKKVESSSDEGETPIVKKSKTKSDAKKVIEKSAVISSDSEGEPLASSSKNISEKSNMENKEDSSMDENEEKPIVKKGKSATKAKEHKKLTPSEVKLENLKKYVRAAGIHVNSYDRLFENCKSMKSKSEKLMHLLQKEGLKGRPSLERCKKLKKKIETKREVAELDLSNIISSGRPKRSACTDTTNCINDDDSDVPLSKYSRLKGIVDSEDSD